MKLFILACSTLFIFACNQSSKPTDAQDTPMPEAPAPEQAVVSDKWPDPVCRMPYDTSYKEWTVYQSDTIHFCSTTCKGVFEKNPEKFMARLKK
ncbi:YHS domain-containing protein [Chitinophaga sp. MM2321]|uniref:YHS domain-containing protein n=1 Tax=Chitinophaga sp. MM2321 TaxID=3137178 RepID=UPI0032D57BED